MNMQDRAELARGIWIIRVIMNYRKAGPISAESLHEQTGVDTRIIAEIAKIGREYGFWVCAGARGYYFAESAEEFKEFLERERRRAVSVLKTRHLAIRNIVQQDSLFDNIGGDPQ
jgi:hypothetical protein